MSILVVTWVVMLLAFIPMTAVETVAMWAWASESGWTALTRTASANLLSMGGGIPLTGIALLFVRRASGRPAYANPKHRLFYKPWAAAGVVVTENTPRWALRSPLASLIAAYFVTSCLIDGFLFARPGLTSSGPAVAGALLADLVSYSLLLVVVRLVLGPERDSTSRASAGVNLQLTAIAVSHDKRTIAAAWNGTVKILDRASGQELVRLKRHDSDVTSVTFSPDDSRLLSNSRLSDFFVSLWTTGKRERRFSGGFLPLSAAWSPDGRYVAAGFSDDGVLLWDAATWEVVPQLEGMYERDEWSLLVTVACLEFSADGHYLAAWLSECDEVWLWSMNTQNVFRKLPAPVTMYPSSNYVQLLSVSASQPVLAATDRSALIIWNYEADVSRRTSLADGLCPVSMCFSRDARELVFGCDDGRVRVWDIEAAAIVREVDSGMRGHTYTFHLTADGTWMAFGQDSQGRMLMCDGTDQMASPIRVLTQEGWQFYSGSESPP